MKVTVNGNAMDIAEGTTLAALLGELRLSDARVAVEHNRVILQRESYASTELSEGDELEILGFVGGG